MRTARCRSTGSLPRCGGEDAPRSARGLVSTYVWRVRGLLDRPADPATSRIVGEPPGYRLQLQPAELDVTEFTRLTGQAQQALRQGEPERARQALHAALALWRGEPAENVRLFGGFEADLDQLAEMRAAALEARIAADLACGRHLELVAELRRLTSAYPLREGFAAQLVLSLARCGRQAESLSAYHAVRHRIAEELGTDPGPELRRVYEAVLRGDPDLTAVIGLHPAAPTPAAAGPTPPTAAPPPLSPAASG
jgi:DNA-binding SARP family transcriptional activator